MVDNKTAST
jgi:hypothetical protein